MTTTYRVGGVPLDDPDGRWRLLTATSFTSALSTRSVSTSVPGVDGSLSVPAEQVDDGSLQLVMLVTGRDSDDLRRNLAGLSLVLSPSGPVAIERITESSTTSTTGRGKSVTEPDVTPGFRSAQVTATLRLPDPFWRGSSAPYVGVSVAGGAHWVSTLDGSSAPIIDALILVGGPATNPKVSCGGAWFRLGLTLAAGEAALVDCTDWSVHAGSGVTLAGGGAVRSGALTTSGGPLLLPLVPQMVGADPTMTRVMATVTADAGTPSLSVLARPAYRM